jgi:sialate O-acetylesterase
MKIAVKLQTMLSISVLTCAAGLSQTAQAQTAQDQTAQAQVPSPQVALPKILSDHMVVQRELPVHVWGTGPLGDHITVSFRGESRTVDVDRIGRWSIYLKPGAAGGPFEMTVKGDAAGDTAAAIHDILVGDVWVASGQSNMEYPMLSNWSHEAHADAELPKADNPKIRLLIVNQKAADYPQDDIPTAGWAASTPETAKDFSAVAWYFAREIETKEHVPVGVIDSTWGGTVAEAWVRMTALGEDAALNPLFASRGRMQEEATDNERTNADEQRQIAEAKAAGKPIPNFSWHAPLPTWGPANLYNGMIAPLTPFAIRGVIWYQGESNSATERWPLYNRIMRTLIEDWRRQWAVGDFPFYYVQISNFNSTPLENWANLRQQQVETLGLRNTAMAVTIDIGTPDNVHPPDKVDVGHRLAIAARALNYGEAIEYSGPLFRQAAPENGAMRVWFDHAKGLTAKGGPSPGEVTSVEVAGKDGKFVPAKAVIEGGTLLASSPDVPNPLFVRYGWANSPQCNLFNGEGLPASPFTSKSSF